MSTRQLQLVRRIESGALADLYDAKADGRVPVVVKLVHEQYSDPAYARSIADTARVLNPIDAMGLIRYLEIGVVQKRLAIVREAVDGFSIGAALARLNTREVILPSAIALHWLVELLELVDRAHQEGLAHGSITPGNVLLSRGGAIHACDFGTLEAIRSTPALKKAFGDTGRGSYRAPEILRGEPPTVQSDLYSIAALGYELLTLREPANGATAVGTRREALPPPSRVDRRLNSRLDPLIMRALEPVPGRRYRSGYEFAQSLRRFITENGGIPTLEDRMRCAADLAPGDPPASPLPITGGFRLSPIEGSELLPLPERTVVFAKRPAFSGGELQDGEFPADAATVQSPPAFEEFKPPPAPAAEPTKEKTDPGAAGPLEKGWEAPPAAVLPKRADRSFVGPAPVAPVHRRVKKIEDFSVVEDADGEPGFRERSEPSRVAPAPSPPKERTRIGPAPERPKRPVPDTVETPEPSVSGARPLRTAERLLIAAVKRNQRFLSVTSFLAVLGAAGFAFAIWKLNQQRLERAQHHHRHVIVIPPAPVADPPAPKQDPAPPVQSAKPAPPPAPKPQPVQHAVATTPEFDRPPRSGAGYLSITSNVPAYVFIDGSRVRQRTPLSRYPVRPGRRRIVLEAVGTRDRRDFTVRVIRGKLRRIDELDLVGPP